MSLARHTASSLFAYGLPLAAGILCVPFYLRLLGEAGYGGLILLLALLNYSTALDLGGGKAAAFLIAKARTGAAEIRSTVAAGGIVVVLLVCVPLAACMLIGRAHLANLLPEIGGVQSGELVNALTFAVLTVPTMALISFLTGLYQGELRFFRLNGIQAAGGVALQLLPLAVCWFVAPRLDVAMGAILATRLAMTVAMLAYTGSAATIAWALLRPDGAVLRELIRFGRWPAVTNLLAAIMTSGDRFVVSNLAGASAVTAYAVPLDLANRLMIVVGSVANTLFPALAGDEGDAARKSRSVGRALISILTPISAAMIVLFYPGLQVWIGDKLADRGRMIGEVIVVGVWATAITAIAQTRLLASDRGKLVVASYTCQLPLFFLGAFLGMSWFGLIGVAVAWSIRCHVDAVALLVLSGDGLGLLREIWPHFLVLILALIAASIEQDIVRRLGMLLGICAISVFFSRASLMLVARRLLAG